MWFPGKTNGSRGPIGIDLGGRCVKLMQLDRRGGRLEATAAHSVALPPDTDVADPADYAAAAGEAIKRSLSTGGFRGRSVVASLPAASVRVKSLRMPVMEHVALSQAVEAEASGRLQLGHDPHVLQHLIAGEVRQGDEVQQEVVMLAAPLAMVEAIASMLESLKLQPLAIDLGAAALARCVALQDADGPAEGPEVRVAVDLGHSATQVLIVREGRLVFYKSIPLGGRDMDRAVAEQLGSPVEEIIELRHRVPSDGEGVTLMPGHVQRALIDAARPTLSELGREIGLCLRYYSVTFRGSRPARAMLLGGESRHAWLPPMLGEHAGIEVVATDPLEGVDLSAVSSAIPGPEHAAAWGVAAGLSLRTQTQEARRVAA